MADEPKTTDTDAQPNDTEPSQSDQFAQAAEEAQIGIVREFWDFLRYNKKWWLTPIILILLLLTGIMVAGGGALSTLLYPLL